MFLVGQLCTGIRLRIQILLGPDIDPTNYGWARDNTMKSLKPKDFDVAPSEVLNFIKCHSRRGRPDKRRDGNKPKPVVGDRGKAILESIDDNSLVIQSFRQYGAELDAKHDKHERIVKHSRDITIESKRIIFLLHTLDRYFFLFFLFNL
uniref:Uncharacterized protein n=1 Tax=Timema poppense TaxID=170557 RepID=A0A7R9H2L4_TIMPO|nr:unnamed protein product [Timema poppensis]